MTIDNAGRYFIMQDSFKYEDKSNSGIPLNEIVMQNFLDVAKSKASDFRVMFIVNVQNQEFWDVTRANYDSSDTPFDQVMTWKSDSFQFKRYMGSPNISSKLFGFLNHHIALGKRKPVQIVVIPQQVKNSEDLSVALVFE
jgi:hypothetical protein